MNPAFLAKLAQISKKKTYFPPGVAISNVRSENKDVSFSKVLVIPPGLGKQVSRFRELGAVILENIDRDYPENSIEDFLTVLRSLKPALVVAGSRGTALVTAALRSDEAKFKVLLFGPTKLFEYFQANRNTKTTIVHGTSDPNEQIQQVRSYVSNKTKLIEVTTQGHSLDIQSNKLNTVVKYAY